MSRRRALAASWSLIAVIGCGSGGSNGSAANDVPSATAPSMSAGPAAVSNAPSPAAAATPTRTPTPTVGGGPSVDIIEAGATRVSQGGDPDWVAITGDSVWVAVSEGIQELDVVTGERRRLAPVQSICTAMDTGMGALWAAECRTNEVVRVDPKTATVTDRFAVTGGAIQSEGSITAADGVLWVATDGGSLVRVDVATGKATTTSLGMPGAGVRAGLGSIWVTVPDDDVTLQVDPTNGTVTRSIPTGDGPRFLAVGEDAVWVQDNGDGTVTRIGADGQVVATIQVSAQPIDGGDMAAGGGYAWARISAGLIAKVDPSTNEVVATYGPPSGSGSVAADDAAAWVSAHDVSALWRLPLTAPE